MGQYLYAEVGREYPVTFPDGRKVPVKRVEYRCKPAVCSDPWPDEVAEWRRVARLVPHRFVVLENGVLHRWEGEPRAAFLDDSTFGIDLHPIGQVVDGMVCEVQIMAGPNGCRVFADGVKFRLYSPLTGTEILQIEATDSSRLASHWLGFLANQPKEVA